MRKRAVSLALCLCMVLSLLPSPVLAVGKHPFTDVAATDWFNDSVAYVYERNLMKGTSDTTFAPYRATQRGMIVTILHRLEGTPTVASENPFADVPKGSNYENAIIWAAANGIVNGYDNATFGPYENITRQQMAAILYRYSQMKGYRTSTSANLGEYTDSTQIGDYARSAMAWANGEGLINGNSSKQLMPTGNATRAQTAAILTRFCQNVVPQQTPVSPPIEEPPQITPEPVTPTSYTVTFDLNYAGGGIYQTLSVKAGEKVTSPTKPSRDKYSFLGWYTAVTGGSKFNFNSVINATITLYARWSRKSTSNGSGSYTPVTVTPTYTVTFNSNDGSQVNAQVITSGQVASRPMNPTKEGYVFNGWYTNSELTNGYDFDAPVTSNITLYAKWDAINPDECIVYYNLNYNGTVNTIPNQTVKIGAPITFPDAPSRDNYEFIGWSLDNDKMNLFMDSYSGISESITLYAYWVSATDASDEDSDGLIYMLEAQYQTNPNDSDTDHDGLSDYTEIVILETDPLKADTDGNGVSDGDEDFDKDGLSNAEEEALGTSALIKDSDMDGLTDADEVKQYRTNPANEDTDGDGATDGLEIKHGTNPLEPNGTFEEYATSETLSEINPVAVSVATNVSGNQLGTLSVNAVTRTDNPLLSSTLPGYLGSAYELSVNGEIDDAVVTFSYDTSLGVIGENFEPRIYYLNPETQLLEELPNQTVQNGSITAHVEHFSTYMLLDKEQFDSFWDNEILLPVDASEGLEFAFVIDGSGSMSDNDPENLAKQLSKNFLDMLHKKDRASVIVFNTRATVLKEMTSDIESLKSSVDAIRYSGGTNGQRGLEAALQQFTLEGNGRKFIVFLTDGQDTDNTNYDNIISSASTNGIRIFTIGMANATEAILRKVAEGTNGSYYYAYAKTPVDDEPDDDNQNAIEELEEVFEDIQKKTLNISDDSNDDEISDYYTFLIYTGRICLGTGSTILTGVNFQDDPDLDHDGIKNGDEIKIVNDGNKVYVKMISDPLSADGDCDGMSDALELNIGTNPLEYTFNHASARGLYTNDMYADYLLAESYINNDAALKIRTSILDFVSLDLNFVGQCRDVYLDYLNKYSADVNTISILYQYDMMAAEINARQEAVSGKLKEQFDGIVGSVDDLNDAYGDYVGDTSDFIAGRFDDVHEALKVLDQALIRNLNMEIQDVTRELNVIRSQASAAYRIDPNSLSFSYLHSQMQTYQIKLNDLNGKMASAQVVAKRPLYHKVKLAGDVISWTLVGVSSVLEMRNTFEAYGTLCSNVDSYKDSIALFEYVQKHGTGESEKMAAGMIRDAIESDFVRFCSMINAAAADVAGNLTIFGVNEAAKAELAAVYGSTMWAVGVVIAVHAITNWSTGALDRVEKIHNAVYYKDLTDAAAALSKSVLRESALGYDCAKGKEYEALYYLTELAQLRIVGEDNYVNYSKNKGWFKNLFKKDFEEARDFCESRVQEVYNCAETLHLGLAKSLLSITQTKTWQW